MSIAISISQQKSIAQAIHLWVHWDTVDPPRLDQVEPCQKRWMAREKGEKDGQLWQNSFFFFMVDMIGETMMVKPQFWGIADVEFHLTFVGQMLMTW